MDNKTFCNVFPAFKGGAELDALFSDTQVESIKTYETKKQMIVTLQSDHLIPYHMITRMEALLTQHAYHMGGAGKKIQIFMRYQLSEQYDVRQIAENYKESLLEELRSISRIAFRLMSRAEWYYNEDVISIAVEHSSVAKEHEKLIRDFLVSYFRDHFGKEIEVVPIRVDLTRIRIIVSQLHAVRKQQKADRKQFLSQLEVGQVYEGVVKNVESYGAFVELHEGVEGLLHISEFDHNRVAKPEKVLNTGDTVKVQVIKIEKDHIGLSRKALLPNHWANYFAEKQLGDVVTVKATDVKSSGVRVELAPELEGFIPRSEYSWDRDADVEKEVKVGDELSCKIIETDKGKRRIILSVKQLAVNPWTEVKVATGDILDVKILEVAENGYKVEYQGIKGYMSKGAVKPSEADKVVVDAVIKVKVRAFDADKQKFIVSMRDAEEKEEKENFNKYKSTDKMSNTFGDYLNDLKKK